MELIKTYIGYIVGILGFAGIIWTYASKSTSKDFNVASLKANVMELKNEMVTKSDLKVFADSIGMYNFRMEHKMNQVVKSQNALRASYVTYIKSAVKDRDYFIELMNGIEWVVSPIEDKRTNSVDSFKIQINKKK
jgi:hypothetical protein